MRLCSRDREPAAHLRVPVVVATGSQIARGDAFAAQRARGRHRRRTRILDRHAVLRASRPQRGLVACRADLARRTPLPLLVTPTSPAAPACRSNSDPRRLQQGIAAESAEAYQSASSTRARTSPWSRRRSAPAAGPSCASSPVWRSSPRSDAGDRRSGDDEDAVREPRSPEVAALYQACARGDLAPAPRSACNSSNSSAPPGGSSSTLNPDPLRRRRAAARALIAEDTRDTPMPMLPASRDAYLPRSSGEILARNAKPAP